MVCESEFQKWPKLVERGELQGASHWQKHAREKSLCAVTAAVTHRTAVATFVLRRGTNGEVISEFPPQILENYEYLDSVKYQFR